jgi:hypothetical protein
VPLYRSTERTIAESGVSNGRSQVRRRLEAARTLTYHSAVMTDRGKGSKEYVSFLSMANCHYLMHLRLESIFDRLLEPLNRRQETSPDRSWVWSASQWWGDSTSPRR